MKAPKPAPPKDRWTTITNPAEAVALQANGKWDNAKPTWRVRDGVVSVLVDEIFQAWRAARATPSITGTEHG